MRFTNLLTLLAATTALSYTVKRDEIDDKINQINQAIESNGGDMDKISQVLENNGGDINQLNQAIENNGGDVNQLGQALGGNDDLEKIADGVMDNVANNKTSDGNASNINVSTLYGEECANIVVEYTECFDASKDPSQEEICNAFNSEKCQNLLKKDTSACKEYLGTVFDFSIGFLKIACAKDENGKFCPQSKAFSMDKTTSEIKDNLDDNEIKEICKSSTCTDKAIDAINQLKKANEKVGGKNSAESKAEFEKYINGLNKCKAESSESSGATQIKVGSALLASLALAFYLL